MTETATSEMAGRNCPYCRFPIKEGGGVHECGHCHAVHHEDCWTDNGGCAITSCAGGPGSTPTVVSPPVAGYPSPPPAKLPPPPAAAYSPGVAPPTPGRAELNVAASDFVAQLQAQLRMPGVRAACVAAGYATLVVLGVGLVLSVVFPGTSMVGLVSQHGSFVTGAFRQAVQELQAPFGGQRLGPALLVLVPIAACAVFCIEHQRQLEPTGARLAWGAAVGVPFALFMALVAAIAGNPNGGVEGLYLGDASVGSAFLLGLLWGGIGGAIGAWVGLRRAGWRDARWGPDHRARRAADVAWAALRPLAVALVLATVVGTAWWTVEVVRGKGFVRDELNLGGTKASLPSALGQTLLYSADHGVHTLELGTGTKFAGYLMPLPVDRPDKITGATGAGARPRIFDYGKAMAVYLFVPLLILILAIPAVLALYAGFATARTRAHRSRGHAAALGALVGPIWALAAVVLNALVQKQIPAAAVGDSVFLTFLLGGAALGALGGSLAYERSAMGAAPDPTTKPYMP